MSTDSTPLPVPSVLRRLAGSPRSTLWWVVFAGLGVAMVLGCSGLLAGLVFQQYSETKWLLTVLGPATVMVLMVSKHPLTYAAAAVVLALPFMPIAVSFRGESFRAVAVLLTASVVIAFLSSAKAEGSQIAASGPRSANPVGRAATVAALLLFPAAARGLDPPLWFVQVAAVLAVGYVVSRACQLDPQGNLYVLGALGGSVALQGLLAVREFQTGRPFNVYGSSAGYGAENFFSYGDVVRPSGSFFDPISLGNVLAMACPMLVAMACHRGFSPLLRLWFAICCLWAAGGLVLTLSRLSWIGAVVGIVVVVALSTGGERVRQISLLVVGAVIVSGTAVALAGPSLLLRFKSILNPTAPGVSTAGGDETRQQLWAASYDAFTQHPLAGVGTGNLHAILVERVGGAGLFGHAHSTYLQILAECGIFGGLAIAVLGYATLAEIVRRLKSTGRQDLIARACAGGLVALALVWSTDYTVRYTAVLTCMALPVVLLVATRRMDSAAHLAPAAPDRTARQSTDPVLVAE